MMSMLSLQEMQIIAENENVIFYKPGCPFCVAAEKLIKELVELKIISDYKVYFLGIDFDNRNLTDLVKEHGWKTDAVQEFCTKPQIFFKNEYIGGNFEFYKSRWNLGEKETGLINDKIAPQKTNPMRF